LTGLSVSVDCIVFKDEVSVDWERAPYSKLLNCYRERSIHPSYVDESVVSYRHIVMILMMEHSPPADCAITGEGVIVKDYVVCYPAFHRQVYATLSQSLEYGNLNDVGDVDERIL
jgi:hypothetical protein